MGSLKMKTIAMVDMDCCVCGIDYGMPEWLYLKCRETGRSFYCPSGHSQSYTEPEVVKLRKQVARLESRTVHLEDQRLAAERSANAYKGKVTQLRNRVANGVCPCCHRHFANVERHMQTKHPDFAAAGGHG